MGVLALTNEYLAINAVAMSDHVKQAVLTVEASALDSTAMGDAWTEVTFGLKSGQLQVEFLDDFAASQVDALLWPLFGTLVTFEVRPTADAVSATNPKYTGTIGIAQFAVGGQLNEMAMKGLQFPTSGTVTRATA